MYNHKCYLHYCYPTLSGNRNVSNCQMFECAKKKTKKNLALALAAEEQPLGHLRVKLKSSNIIQVTSN